VLEAMLKSRSEVLAQPVPPVEGSEIPFLPGTSRG
jgi:hypothetical protein